MDINLFNNIKNKMLKIKLNKYLDNLDDISSFDLIIKLSSLSTSDVDKLIQRKNIKNKLTFGLLEESKGDFYAGFREIAEYFTVEQIFSLFDVQTLKKYFSERYKSYEYIFFVVLFEKDVNASIKYIIENDEMFDELFSIDQSWFFSDLNYDLFKEIILKMGNNIYSYQTDFVSNVSSEFQNEILKENLSDELIVYLLPKFHVEVISDFFCSNPKGMYLFDKFDIRYFALSGIRFNDEIIKKKTFFEKIKCIDFVYFRKIINAIEKHNNTDIIEKRLNSYYDEIISSYDELNDMFKEYVDRVSDRRAKGEPLEYIKNDISNYQNLTSKKLSEVIVDALFQDNIYNVWLNLREMLRYNSKLSDNEKVIPKEREDFYKKILDFDSVHSKEKIELFHKLRDKRVNYMFYDDLRKLKDLSYDMIKEELFDVSNKKNAANINSELSDKYGVTIYDMRDKEFTMLIRGQLGFREEFNSYRSCYSIIGNDNTSAYGLSDRGLLYYGYNSFDNDKVIHVLEEDAYSSNIENGGTKYVNRIMTSSEIIKGSTWYSEIQLVNVKSGSGRYTTKRPDYIVFYDNGKCNIEDSVNEAKRLNVPIVIIKETKLLDDKKIDISFDKEKDYYIENDSSLLYNVRNGRNGKR